jgi:hypothetical protein
MELAYAFLAEAAEISRNGRFFTFNGGIESLTCASFPATIPTLAVVAKLRILPAERDVQHAVSVRFVDPDEAPFGPNFDSPVHVVKEGHPADRELYYVLIVNLIGLSVHKEGRHQVLILADDEELGRLTIYADRPPVPTMTQETISEGE